MPSSCVGCVCASPRVTPRGSRLLLATQVEHTVGALRTLARRSGHPARLLGPGLIALDTTEPDGFLALCRAELSAVESDEVRCVVMPAQGLPDVSVLTRALTAPTLSEVGARISHAGLLPLFADETACFHAVYQPVVALADRVQVGYEALLRATTPDGTVVMPDVLFPAAHEAGWTHLVDRIGRTTALRDAASWLPPEQLLFINFIPTSIYRPEVCLQTTELAAQDAGISLSQIVFEVTEGHEVRDLGHLEHVFDYYRSHDCKVALDDLGAGYSSLNILVRLRPDIVKLDKELVQALPDPTARTVISAIVDITKSYGGQVLAECIETEQQAVVALELGVDLGQGWLFGRPERPAVKPTALASPRSTAHPVRPDRASSLLGPTHVEPGRPDKAVAVTLPEHLHAASSGPAGMDGLLARAVDGSDSGVVVVDMLAEDQPMLYVNPAFERMTGYSSGDVVGRNCRLLQSADTDPAGIRGLSQAIRHGQEHRCVVLNQRKNGTLWWNELHLSPVRDEVGQLTHYLGYQHDVSDRVRAEQDLSRQATQDSLTGLANRGHLFEYLELALQAAADASRAVAVLFLDLDGFKDVNDKHGHAAGDAVLVQLAERLRVTLRTSDLICRNGGDEFVVVLGDLDPFDAGRIAARASVDVNGALRRPFLYPPHILHLGVSVGLALFPEDATSSDRLLAAADSDMYRVKRQRITQGEPALDQY